MCPRQLVFCEPSVVESLWESVWARELVSGFVSCLVRGLCSRWLWVRLVLFVGVLSSLFLVLSWSSPWTSVSSLLSPVSMFPEAYVI